MLYDFLRPIIKVLCKILYKVEVTGLENLPSEDEGYII